MKTNIFVLGKFGICVKTKNKAKLHQFERKYFGDDRDWRLKSANTRTRIELAQSFMPLESRSKARALRYAGLRTERVRDAVDVCCFKLRKKFKKVANDKILKGAFLNVSQCVGWLCVTRGHLPTFTTSAKFYSYERDVVLTGRCVKTNTNKQANKHITNNKKWLVAPALD